MLSPPSFIRPKRRSRGKKGDGERFEIAAQKHLQFTLGDFYVQSPWFRFISKGDVSLRWCQPDGLHFDFYAGEITLVEIKLKHTAAAWWQTRQLYQPVVEFLFPASLWSIKICEVVRWLDPDTDFPEHYSDARTPLDVPRGRIGVHVLSRRKMRGG